MSWARVAFTATISALIWIAIDSPPGIPRLEQAVIGFLVAEQLICFSDSHVSSNVSL